MTTLREAAQQALEAWDSTVLPQSHDGMMQERMQQVEALHFHKGGDKVAPPLVDRIALMRENERLRAALAEEPDSTKSVAEQEPQGCEHCNHPLYAAVKCRVCGRVTEPAEPVAYWNEDESSLAFKPGRGAWVPLYSEPKPCPTCEALARTVMMDQTGYDTAPPERPAEPVQEPVAWMDIDSDGNRLSVRQWSDGNRDEVPLYTAPPQRKPLTEEEIYSLFRTSGSPTAFARAIERVHGIT